MAAEPSRRRRPRQSWASQVPLRTQLTVWTVVLVGVVIAAIGFFSHTFMERSLTAQMDEQLTEASARASHFSQGGKGHDGSAPQDGGSGKSPTSQSSSEQGASGQGGSGQGSGPAPDPLNAPGQGPGALNALLANGAVSKAQVVDASSGQPVQLGSADKQALASASSSAAASSGQAVTVSLSSGEYRIMSAKVGAQTLITGLPMERTHTALKNLALIELAVGGFALTLAAGAAMLLVGRATEPLERVARVARSASSMPMDAGEVAKAPRVSSRDSAKNTEAGAVGHALNQLLDSVEGALTARQASEQKLRQFVADASHELRNPLAVVRGYADLISATEHLSDDGRASLERVRSQAQHMSSLVEDLLLLARLDAEQNEGREAKTEPVDLTQVVLETVSDVRVSAPDHQWRLDLPEEAVELRGDSQHLRQLLMNLLSNARKHTTAGTTVTTGLRLVPGIPTHGRLGAGRAVRDVLLTVADNGEGIEESVLPTLFERFTRADAARSGQMGTTGLGLSIVAAIAQEHGGEVDVESRPGRTVFSVRLPLERQGG